MKPKIISCTCKHNFQDEKYGKTNRVHNILKSGEKVRCTVCSNEKVIKKEAK